MSQEGYEKFSDEKKKLRDKVRYCMIAGISSALIFISSGVAMIILGETHQKKYSDMLKKYDSQCATIQRLENIRDNLNSPELKNYLDGIVSEAEMNKVIEKAREDSLNIENSEQFIKYKKDHTRAWFTMTGLLMIMVGGLRSVSYYSDKINKYKKELECLEQSF